MKNDVRLVKEICDKMGNGNVMSIASALWRKELKEKNLPESNAFIPVCIVDGKIIQPTEEEIQMYDDLVKTMH